MLEFVAFWVLSLVAPRLPPRVAYPLCGLIGDISWRVLARRRRVVERNLSVVLGGGSGDLSSLSRTVFREGTKYYYDTFRVPAMSIAGLENLVAFEGVDRLSKVLERRKGAIVVTAHLGSPSLVVQILAIRGIRITTVAEPVKPQRLFNLLTKVRTGKGIRLIPLDSGCTRDLAETLRRNEVVGLVADRDIAKNGVVVEFFGTQTSMPAGPAILALRTGAPLVPGYTCRREDGGFSGFLAEPMEVARTGDLRQDIQKTTQKVARALESAIKAHPEQWIVFEPVWPEKEILAQPGAGR